MTFKKIINFFSSVKLAVTLLIAIIAASVVGTFIPQSLDATDYIQKFGSYTYKLFYILGITDIYHCWWFVGLLVLFALNLLVCTFMRLKFLNKSIGLIITHLSILIILGGSIISAVFGERGMMSLEEGKGKNTFSVGSKVKKLDFQVYLDDFTLEWYREQSHKVAAHIKDKDIKKVFIVEIGKSYYLEGSEYSLKVLKYVPDFYLDRNKNVKTRGEFPNNAALLVQLINGKTEEKRWLFSEFPDFLIGKDKNIDLYYRWQGRIKDFKSKLRIMDNGSVGVEKTIEVNVPLKYKGYTFYQSSYNPENLNWTGLQVVKDPGVFWVYFGFLLLNIGIFIVFLKRIRFK